MLIIFEGISRFIYKPEVLLNDQGYRAILKSREYHHDYRPDQHFFRFPDKLDEFSPVSNRINSFGIRTGSTSHQPDSAHSNILLIGDSFIQAEEMEFDFTVGQVLQRKFDMDPDDNFQIIQKGMSSWSPLLELNWLMKKGIDLKPEYVVLFLCINDFFHDYKFSDYNYTQETIFDENGYPLEFNIDIKSDIDYKKYTKGKIYLRDLLKKVLSNEIVAPLNFSNKEIEKLLNIKVKKFREYFKNSYPKKYSYNKRILDIIELTRSLDLWDTTLINRVNMSFNYLDKIDAVLNESGSNLVIAFTPLGWNINKNENYEGRKRYLFENVTFPMGGIETKIIDFCNENKIKYIDLYAVFINHEKIEKNIFLVSDGHWSEYGHKIVANALYETFK